MLSRYGRLKLREQANLPFGRFCTAYTLLTGKRKFVRIEYTVVSTMRTEIWWNKGFYENYKK